MCLCECVRVCCLILFLQVIKQSSFFYTSLKLHFLPLFLFYFFLCLCVCVCVCVCVQFKFKQVQVQMNLYFSSLCEVPFAALVIHDVPLSISSVCHSLVPSQLEKEWQERRWRFCGVSSGGGLRSSYPRLGWSHILIPGE